MKIVIVGCGRVGAALAESYDAAGHQVVILDISTRAFGRLASTFRGSAVRGDGTDEDTLRRVGAEDADVFLSLTEGDNRNVMAAQVAAERLGAKRVIACRTTLVADAVSAHLGLPVSGQSGIRASSGSHAGHGHELHQMHHGGSGETNGETGASAGDTTSREA